jgi:hypothetical protein
MVIVETWRQHVTVKITRSLNAGIITTREEMVVAPNIDVVERGVLIGSIIKLGSRSGGILTGGESKLKFSATSKYY